MNKFIYFFQSGVKHIFITLFLILELFACMILGAVSFAELDYNYQDMDEQSSFLNCYAVHLDNKEIDEIDKPKLGLFYAPMWFTDNGEKVTYSADNIHIITPIVARTMQYKMKSGKWIGDKKIDISDGEYLVAISSQVAKEKGLGVGDEYPLENIYHNGKSENIYAKIVGVLDKKEKQYDGIGNGYEKGNNELYRFVFVLTSDGDNSFVETMPIRLSYLYAESVEESVKFAIKYDIPNPESIYDNIIEQNNDRYHQNLYYILAFAGMILLTFSTVITATMILLEKKTRENSLNYIFGITPRTTIVMEVLRAIMIFLVPFLLALIVVASTLNFNLLMQRYTLKYFFISAPIVAVIFALADMASIIITLIAKPLDGLKEKTI